MYLIYVYILCVAHTEIISPFESLMAVDKCTYIEVNWNITEVFCRGLSYNVTLTSSDGVLGPFMTSSTVYNFTNVETLNGMFNVTVFAFNGNVSRGSITQTAINGVSTEGMYVNICLCNILL